MKRLILSIAAWGVVLGSDAAVQIKSLRTMTTDNELKVELRLSADKASKFRIKGSVRGQGGVLWSGAMADAKIKATPDTTLWLTVGSLTPELWSPSTPVLYDFSIDVDGTRRDLRIGFRRFEMKDGQFILNGKPIFMRGNAINPPRRGIPADLESSRAFARDYIRFLKGMNINMIRIPQSEEWMDVCDQEGMMVFAGRYGRPRSGSATAPPADLDRAVEVYREEELGPFTSHPSMMIYVLSNEMPYAGAVGDAYRDFLKKSYDKLVKWDNTKLYICNAGYGLGRSADVYDVHRYWGWYYNSFLTYLNLRDVNAWQNEGRVQPITFTECVGNYTGIDGRFNVCSRTKQPGSQLCWTGHQSDDVQAAEALKYQSFMMGNAIEMFRRMRTQNPRLSGIMPFSIIFHNWDGVQSFAQMNPKPAAYQMGTSYQPVLLSWESWSHNLYAGSELKCIAHIVNDSDTFADLTDVVLRWTLESANGDEVLSGKVDFDKIAYYDVARRGVAIKLPKKMSSGDYRLRGVVTTQGKVVSKNATELYVQALDERKISEVELSLYGSDVATLSALEGAGAKVRQITDFSTLKSGDVVVIGEMSWSKSTDGKALALAVERGAKVICLRQDIANFDVSWLPVEVKLLGQSNNSSEYLSPEYSYRDGMNVNIERPEHPIFEGIEYSRMKLWSDYTEYDQSKAGFPSIYPVTNGFSLRSAEQERATVLANYGRSLASTALSEIICGRGYVLLCGFDLAARAGVDPIADRLLVNMIYYAASEQMPDPYHFVDRVIIWGDYASEQGIATGPNNGLLINTYPKIPVEIQDELRVKIDTLGYQYAGSYGGWNNKPGVQYVTQGRRAFAPYDYTLGGSDRVNPSRTGVGYGYILVRVPQGKSKMFTLVENPTSNPIRYGVKAGNMPYSYYTIAPHSSRNIESAIPEARSFRVEFNGGRQAVLRQTEFR